MNRLQHETSPYLLQHASNPVDWYAWKPEAFRAAAEQDKPIMVSIGYSTCHWCHVMEHESFEKETVAAFMNEHFINIKVDREERPDVDQIYMEACQAINGSGGWPLNCFLTPDGHPFFAGTYFPPAPAHGRPSWSQLLQQMANAYQNRRDQVEEQARRLTQMIEGSDKVFFEDKILDEVEEDQLSSKEPLQQMLHALQKQMDHEYGGFGKAPKFPSAMALDLMLQYGHLSGQQEAIDQALFSLDKMIRGGIYDQLGGGFARYATDRAWLVPHFEKMLYDNALLIRLMASAYQLTGKALYRDTLRECVQFVQGEMSHPDGGYFAAYDADSEGEEGKFYVWSDREIKAALGEDAELFMAYYGVSEEGNWEGKNILWRPYSLEEFSEARHLDPKELSGRLKKNRETLYTLRKERVPPGLDDKIILGWNALMATALARAGAALSDRDLIHSAEQNLRFLLSRLGREDGGLWHVYKEGKVQYPAFLDDHAQLIEALITTYECGFDEFFLKEAERLTGRVLEHFDDPGSGLFFYTPEGQEDLIVRKREVYDSATPSGNSTMAHNLMRLSIYLDSEAYRDRAFTMLTRMASTVVKYPSSFANWASARLLASYPPFELAVVGPEANDMASALNAEFIPSKIIMASKKGSEDYPLLAGKSAKNDTLIYVCQNYACRQPARTVAEALKLVNE